MTRNEAVERILARLALGMKETSAEHSSSRQARGHAPAATSWQDRLPQVRQEIQAILDVIFSISSRFFPAPESQRICRSLA
jgi:hypothetical protein